MHIGKYEFHRPAARSLLAPATFLRLLLRWVMWCIIGACSLLFVLGITLSIVVQTEWFHRKAADYLTSVLSDQLEARLSFSAVRFNLFKGMELDSVLLTTRGDTVLRARSLRVAYELEPLLLRHIVVRSIAVEAPEIRVLRTRADSSWNVEHIVKPSTTPAARPFDWDIHVRSFTLSSARLVVCDSVNPRNGSAKFIPVHTDFDSLQCTIGAMLNLARQHIDLSIDEFAAVDRGSHLRIDDMHGSIAIDTASLKILHLRIETPQTDLLAFGAMRGINLFATSPDIENAPLDLTLRSESLASDDLNLFLPGDFTLRDRFSVDTRVGGSITHLRCDVRTLATRSTSLKGVLLMDNLANARPFAYTIELQPSKAWYSDIRTVLPTLKLGQLDVADHLEFSPTRIVGSKDSIAGFIDVRGDFGGVRGKLALAFPGTLKYALDLTLSRFDSYPFTKRYSSASRLNGNLRLTGSGTSLDDADASLRLELGASSFGGHDMEKALCVAALSDRILDIDSLSVFFPLSAADSVQYAFDGSSKSLALHCRVDLNDMSLPDVDARIMTSHLPLSDLLHDKQMPIALGVSASLRFKGVHPDSLSGSINADVEEFLLKDGALFPFALKAQLERTDGGHRHLQVESDFLKADVQGRYGLGTAWDVTLAHLGIMDSYVRAQYATVQSDTSSAPRILPYTLSADTLDLRFSLNVKGTAVLAPFVKGMRLDASGELLGRISGSPSCYSFDIDTARVKRLNMDIGNDEVFSQPLRASLHVRTADMTTMPNVDYARIALRCDSVVRVNGLRFVRPRADLDLVHDDASFIVSTRIENHIPVYLSGSMHAGVRCYTVKLDSMHAGWTRTLAFSSLHPATITMRPRGVDVEDLDLQIVNARDRMSINGRFNATRFDSLSVRLQQFDIRTVKRIPELYAVEALQMLDGRVDSLGILINGVYTRPRWTLGGLLSRLRYNDVAIGMQTVAASYDGMNIRGSSFVRRAVGDSTDMLSIAINALPLDISLQPMQASLRDGEKVDISLSARDMSLAAVSPFVPGVANLDGDADAQLHIGGTTPGDVDYTGAVTYERATFNVPATNMRYKSDGHLSLKNTTVMFDSLRIYNEESDLRGGMAVVLGSMRIRGFSVRDLDIHAEIPRRSKFQVMSEATAATSDFMYGRTLVSTQDNDADKTLRQLHFHGTPEQPLLTGFVMIEDADVKFPPTVNRTTRASTFEYQRVGNRYVWTSNDAPRSKRDSAIGDLPAEEPEARAGSVQLGKSFTDILRTEVDVKIASSMSVQMDFGFNDQLVAVVRQDNPKEAMRFIRLGSDSTSLRSDLIVDNSSTYKFYETFRASGKMNINGPIDNPRLDLRAVLRNERIIRDRKSNYKVFLNITGTKKKPVLKMDYEIDGNDHPGDVGETEITTNAVLLTLFGYTQVELSGSAGSAPGAVGNKLGASTLGVLLNRVLQGGVIKNVNVDFSGGSTDFSQARIQITAGLYGANVTLGGTVADPTVTLDWALGEFVGANWVTQFMRATNPGATISRQQKQWEVRVGASIP